MTHREVLLRKRSRLLLPVGEARTEPHVVLTLNRNLETLGFTLAPAVIERLTTHPLDDVVALYHEIVPVLKEMVGAHVRHRPMYPNFPKQVMEMTEAELYANALMHYLGDWVSLFSTSTDRVRILPKTDVEERTPLLDEVELRVIALGEDGETMEIFGQLVGARTSISEQDRELIRWFVMEHGDDILPHVPAEVPFKEQLCHLVAAMLDHTAVADLISDRVATATDVLRIACSLSSGDVSLATPTKFKRWTRKERRTLLGYLDSCGNIEEDMARHPDAWVTLLHGLHVGDYAKRFPRSFAAAEAVRGASKIRTFNSKVELAIASGELDGAVELLATRPGDFARRLDKILRSVDAGDRIPLLDRFLSVADGVATPVLLQVYNHFDVRDESARRPVFPKGVVAKMRIVDPIGVPLEGPVIERAVGGVRSKLVERFSALPAFEGPCYIDPALDHILVPSSQRSASKSLRTITRGSKLALPEGDILRFFVHWMEAEGADSWSGRIDVDLSCMFLDEDFSDCGTISYYNLRDFGGHHSGDLTSAPPPDGASEFIDIDMVKLVERAFESRGGRRLSHPSTHTRGDIRYVAMCLNSYSQQPFVEMPVCLAGWMSRQHPNFGGIFDPRTVVDRFDVASNTKVCVPVLFDIVERRAIWVDMGLRQHPAFVNNVHSNKANLTDIVKAMSELGGVTLGDLLRMHVEARGTLVDDPSEADVVFDMDFATDVDRIASEYI